MAIDKVFNDKSIDNIADSLFNSVSNSVSEVKAMQQRKAAENVDLVIKALKQIEFDIRSHYDDIGNSIEQRVASIRDGKDGKDGKDGRNGKDGRDGKQGVQGNNGKDGRDGRDGVDGVDGVSVTSAHIDFDGSLIIGLSSGVELNVGEVVAPDLAESIKVITNGGGTSQSVLDTLDSLQTQINNLSNSQNITVQVRNTTGATLTKGTAVYISGATGQIPTVSKALATSDATSAQTLGLISSDLANNTNGYVTIIGLISNINTSAFTDGAQLYLSGTTAGTLTATKPYAPTHLVYVAVVEYAHINQGKLFVKVQNGYELDEIHNVSAQTPSNGQTIVYNSTTSLWENSFSPILQPRVVAIADATSVTINADTTDIATQANTQAVGTLTINAPTGTPVNGQRLIFRLVSTNVQTFSWNAIFQGSTDLVLPTASSGSSKYDYVGFVYNSTSSKWQLLGKVFGF